MNEYEFDLFWHALNYRGAATQHAQQHWEALEGCVNRLIAREREECASIVENANTPDCGGWTAQGIADAIRARGKA